MEFNFLYSLVFAGIIQGLFLSVFILSSKKKASKASLYLGFLILSITLANLQYTAEELEYISWHTFNLLYLPYLFLLPPFIYFFISNYFFPKRTQRKVERLLYVPFFFFLVVTIYYKLVYFATGKTCENDYDQSELADIIDVYGDFVNIPVVLVVIVVLHFKIKRYKNTTKRSTSKIVITELLWIKIFLGVQLVILIPWFIYTVKYWRNEETAYMPMFLISALVIYIFGYIGIHKINILNQRKKIRSYVNESRSYSIVEKPKNEHIANLEEIIIRDKRYLDPNLSLETVAEEVKLSKSHLSRIINSELQTSFNDYINSLRISEAKKLLLNPQFSNYTLVSIGLEAGFNSKTTFNTVFKKSTGLTPSQYRKSPTN